MPASNLKLPQFFRPRAAEGEETMKIKKGLSDSLGLIADPKADPEFRWMAKASVQKMAADEKALELTEGKVVYKIVETLGQIFQDESLDDKARIDAITLMVNIASHDQSTNGDIVNFALDQMRPANNESPQNPAAEMPGFVDGFISLTDRAVEAATLHLMLNANTVRHVKAWAIEDSPIWKVPSSLAYVEKRIDAIECWKANAYDREGVAEMQDRAAGYLNQLRSGFAQKEFPGPQPDPHQEMMHNGFDMYMAVVLGDSPQLKECRKFRVMAKQYGALAA